MKSSFQHKRRITLLVFRNKAYCSVAVIPSSARSITMLGNSRKQLKFQNQTIIPHIYYTHSTSMLVKEVIICQQHIYGYRTQPNMNEIPNDCKCIWGISCQIDFKTFLNGLIFLLKPNCYAKKQSRIFTGSRKIDHGT